MDRVAKLTELQRETLRLVAEGFQSKEIARQHAVTPDAIDARIKAACRVLDVSSRKEAARQVRAFEKCGTYQPLVSQPFELPPLSNLTDEEQVAADEAPRPRLREEVVPFDPSGLDQVVSWTLRHTDATRPKNRLTRKARLIIILFAAVVLTSVGWGLIAGTLAGVEALNKRFGRVDHQATNN